MKDSHEIPVRTDKTGLRSRVELIPGELAVEVYRHELPMRESTLSCWTYVTHGLQRHDQAEIIFTLLRQCDEAKPPKEPIRLFQMIDELTEAGHVVDAGGVTQFGTRSFLGRHLAYIPAQELPGIAVPPGAICAILVTEDEVCAVQEFGITRVMARLGQASRYYPCPPWSDPSRAGICFERTRQESLLGRVPRMFVVGARVYQANGKVILLLEKGYGAVASAQIQEMNDDAGFALLTDLAPEADGCLVWEPGQTGPAAITPDGSTGQRLSGCFLLLAAGQNEDGVVGIEDGFGALLTRESWKAMREAIVDQKRLEIAPTGGRMGLVLEWADEPG